MEAPPCSLEAVVGAEEVMMDAEAYELGLPVETIRVISPDEFDEGQG